MDRLRWDEHPSLSTPVMIAAFEGWNDAGDAASTAVSYLGRRWTTRAFAEVDAEDFYDFSSMPTRPRVVLDDDGKREVIWPANVFCAGATGNGTDVVILRGVEPQLRWKAFCSEVITVAKELEVSLVLTLGALLADVHHAHPVSIVGTSADDDLIDRLDLRTSSYEGPTGIVGVLTEACRKAGLPTASLWAAVPTYVPNVMSPKATLALVERVTELVGATLITNDLDSAAASYERQVSTAVESDDKLAELAMAIEEASLEDDYEPGGEEFIAEVERFLRDQNSDDGG